MYDHSLFHLWVERINHSRKKKKKDRKEQNGLSPTKIDGIRLDGDDEMLMMNMFLEEELKLETCPWSSTP